MEADAIAEGRRCADCGEDFTLTRGEVSFFDRRGLLLPKRCEDCRAARKGAGLEDRASEAADRTR